MLKKMLKKELKEILNLFKVEIQMSHLKLKILKVSKPIDKNQPLTLKYMDFKILKIDSMIVLPSKHHFMMI